MNLHINKQHSLDSYIHSQLVDFGNSLINNDDKYNISSVKQEIEVDSLAMVWNKNSQHSQLGIFKSHKCLKEKIKATC